MAKITKASIASDSNSFSGSREEVVDSLVKSQIKPQSMLIEDLAMTVNMSSDDMATLTGHMLDNDIRLVYRKHQ